MVKRGGQQQRNTTDQLIGGCLWKERLLAGLSREDIGDWLGVSAEAIRDYEEGEDRISPPELVLAARKLGVPLSFFFPDDEQGAIPSGRGPMERVKRLSARRPLSLLSTSAFAQARPLFELWQATRGELTEDVRHAMRANSQFHRMVVVRNPAGSERLITQHFGAGIKVMRPCESLLAVDRDFYELHPDGDYVAWIAKAYAETLWRRQPHLESIRAFVRMEAGATLVTRYDRLIVPWRFGNGDSFATALSIQRAVPVLSSIPDQ